MTPLFNLYLYFSKFIFQGYPLCSLLLHFCYWMFPENRIRLSEMVKTSNIIFLIGYLLVWAYNGAFFYLPRYFNTPEESFVINFPDHNQYSGLYSRLSIVATLIPNLFWFKKLRSKIGITIVVTAIVLLYSPFAEEIIYGLASLSTEDKISLFVFKHTYSFLISFFVYPFAYLTAVVLVNYLTRILSRGKIAAVQNSPEAN